MCREAAPAGAPYRNPWSLAGQGFAGCRGPAFGLKAQENLRAQHAEGDLANAGPRAPAPRRLVLARWCCSAECATVAVLRNRTTGGPPRASWSSRLPASTDGSSKAESEA